MNKTILIVDDEKDLCNILSDSLSRDRYRVVTAFNGKMGLQLVKKEKPKERREIKTYEKKLSTPHILRGVINSSIRVNPFTNSWVIPLEFVIQLRWGLLSVANLFLFFFPFFSNSATLR